MVFDFLQPVVTGPAFAVIQNQPEVVVTVIIVPICLTGLGLLAWYISWVTNKPYRKLKEAKKPGDGKK
jgi:hypothetical protein